MAQAKRRGSLWRKVLLGFGGFFLLLLGCIIAIPFIVDIDKYRPQVLELANQHLLGKLDIKKLKLSLWGQLEVQILGVRLADAQGEDVVTVGEAYAQIPFHTILIGSPRMTLRIDQPTIHVIKNAAGKLNVAGLAKPAAPTTTPTPTPSPEPTSPPSAAGQRLEDSKIFQLIAASRLGFFIDQANITYRDAVSGVSQDVHGLSVHLKDISMTHPMTISIWGDLKTQIAGTLDLDGPIKINGKIQPQFEGTAFRSAQIALKGHFDDLEVAAANVFHKARGVATNFATEIDFSLSEIRIPRFVIVFHNAQIDSAIHVTGLQASAPNQDPKLALDFQAKSNSIDLKSWENLIVPLRPFALGGGMTFAAAAKGPLSKLDYNAQLKIDNLTANVPGLPSKPTMQLDIDVVTDQLRKAFFNLKMPGNELSVTSSVKGFASPRVDILVDSPGLDVDMIFPPPPEPPAGQAAAPAPASGSDGAPAGKGESTAPPFDVDGSLEPLRTNKVLQSLAVALKVQIASLKARGIAITDFQLVSSFKDLVGAIDNLAMTLFDGRINMNAKVDLKPKMPTYETHMSVDNFNLRTAVGTTLKSFANTILGIVSFKADGNGQSLNSDKILPNLVFQGKFALTEASFTSIDVAKMVTEAFNKSLGGLADKVPMLKDKTLAPLPSDGTKYKVIASDFHLKDGRLRAPNFEATSYPGKGVDLKGKTEMGLLDDTLAAEWFVVDTHNATKAQDLSISTNGYTVEHILVESGKPFSFPIVIGCKLSAPCYQYDRAAEHIGKIALANLKSQVADRIAGELKKKAQEAADKAKAEAMAKKAELEAKAKAAQDEAKRRAEEEKAKAKAKAEDKVKEEGKKVLKGVKVPW